MQADQPNEAMTAPLAERAPHHVVTPTPSTSSTRGTRVVMGLVVLSLVGVGGLIGTRVKQALAKKEQVAADRSAVQAAAVKKPALHVAQPVAMTWKPVVDITGTLRPWREADVGFELGGRLVGLNVAAGANVRSGATLAVLDVSRAAAEVSAAEASTHAASANLALAEDNLKRMEALYATGAIPDAQVLQARQQVALTKAQLEGADASARLARTGKGLHTLVAPFDGVITKAPTAPGGVVQPGAPLLRVEDLSRFRLSASLGEEDATVVKVGSTVDVVYRDRKVTGRVITLVPSLDQATRRAPIEIQVDNDPKQPLLAYSFVHATVAGTGAVQALRLPPTARRPGSQDEVVKVDAGHAKIVHVAHAVDTDGSWIVLRGLDAQDSVVLSPDGDIKDGDPVEVAK
jgi:RND family efflux transporter MFP subunit